MLEKSVVEKCCREVLERSVVEEFCREVLENIVGEDECWRRMLGKSVVEKTSVGGECWGRVL